jgi:hypothetical protein
VADDPAGGRILDRDVLGRAARDRRVRRRVLLLDARDGLAPVLLDGGAEP